MNSSSPYNEEEGEGEELMGENGTVIGNKEKAQSDIGEMGGGSFGAF